MTLDELEALLPNGLHDAKLKRLTVDYEARTAVLKLDVWIGNLDSPEKEVREAYAPGEITVSGLLFCAVEPPQRNEGKGAGWMTGSGPVTPEEIERYGWKLPPVPPDSFCHWLFMSNWNAFSHIVGKDARLSPEPETFWRHLPREEWPEELVPKPSQG